MDIEIKLTGNVILDTAGIMLLNKEFGLALSHPEQTLIKYIEQVKAGMEMAVA
jgi:hypothetical protein